MTPCIFKYCHQYFGDTCLFDLQGRMSDDRGCCFSKTSVTICGNICCHNSKCHTKF